MQIENQLRSSCGLERNGSLALVCILVLIFHVYCKQVGAKIMSPDVLLHSNLLEFELQEGKKEQTKTWINT